jgi:predicted TIM-barrel fold metal-dependent hydrolase
MASAPKPDLDMTASRNSSTPLASSPFAAVRPDWLSLTQESAIEADIPIIDCHHHVWNRAECPYEPADLVADMTAGHRVLASVFVECRSHYLTHGERAFRSLGETEYVGAIEGPRAPGAPRPAAGIVGYVDLQLGSALVNELLQLHGIAAKGRLRGIRNLSASTPPVALDVPAAEPSLLMSERFREGFSLLRSLNLVFDAWMFHTQLRDLVDLARAFPEILIVLNHGGGPTAVGRLAQDSASTLRFWRSQIERVAECDNVHLKIGGLGMPHCGFGFHERPRPPSSADLAAEWSPIVDHCLQAFGAQRCMFESNFPVDKASYSYVTLWNAFKLLTRGYGRAEREQLFWRNAARIYRLEEALAI